ncbi:hypothetical protein BSR29_00595 [Boudabousia liubingyangii]|uniref:WXG100 family type VII secretion target n=1 Tax=Boudabousia liubingyangii TaxID=1921764 RepID=A0A1Q5PQ10_9ACTO|nr:hypothetical protein [Boudabousia liubingyangii]OKL48476.1 hypothetical protein BSR28_01915 [Boudabousia liubingyangii]OKL49495.1 hypothetical protein BSR29_00595 [Boudabousia liubingyangii]
MNLTASLQDLEQRAENILGLSGQLKSQLQQIRIEDVWQGSSAIPANQLVHGLLVQANSLGQQAQQAVSYFQGLGNQVKRVPL